jgi:hypothetical protein
MVDNMLKERLSILSGREDDLNTGKIEQPTRFSHQQDQCNTLPLIIHLDIAGLNLELGSLISEEDSPHIFNTKMQMSDQVYTDFPENVSVCPPYSPENDTESYLSNQSTTKRHPNSH